ncbi:hypothetical protein K501DRAFT_269475 [Backusella circina FSU 941]|nr:hypothetical protein K501DRAFT_269475 [Backusella circina FSU 941]
MDPTYYKICPVVSAMFRLIGALKEPAPDLFKATRPSLNIICAEVEVGCDELMSFRKLKEFIEMDKTRINEICMRQLHAITQKCKRIKENATFGALLAVTDVVDELVAKFEDFLLSKAQVYHHLKTTCNLLVIIPRFESEKKNLVENLEERFKIRIACEDTHPSKLYAVADHSKRQISKC